MSTFAFAIQDVCETPGHVQREDRDDRVKKDSICIKSYKDAFLQINQCAEALYPPSHPGNFETTIRLSFAV